MTNKKEIKCPQCGTAIQIDEAIYKDILDQVKDEAFKEALDARSAEIKAKYDSAIEAARESAKAEMLEKVIAAEEACNALQEKHQAALNKAGRIVQDYDRKIAELNRELSLQTGLKEAAIEAAVSAEREKSHDKDRQIIRLQEDLKHKESEMNAKTQSITLQARNKIAELQASIDSLKASNVIELNAMRESHEIALRAKDDEIAHYKDYRARQTVKLLGESLEEHCRNEYENIRPLLSNATFEKDNVVSETGSKGDFIFREKDSSGSDLVSIMFEMKTEEETSKNKHRNEDFFKELDKDRREKGCEYAVLVSTLESDNDHYNRGIVDVSHRYPKMLVIRPQFFLPLLLLLRSVASDKTDLRRRIGELETEQMSTMSLEHDLTKFRESVLKCHSMATTNKDRAIKHINDTIKLLETIKGDLQKMDKHLAYAQSNAEAVTIKTLAKKHPEILTEEGDSVESTDAVNPKDQEKMILQANSTETKVLEGKFIDGKAG